MEQELLIWVRGTGLQIAAAVFVFGMVYRMLHLLMLGRKKSLAEPRGSEWAGGLRTMWQRSFVLPRLSPRGRFTVVAGYLFHLGFFVALFFLSQHIALFRAVFGFGWPAMPRGVIDIAAEKTRLEKALAAAAQAQAASDAARHSARNVVALMALSLGCCCISRKLSRIAPGSRWKTPSSVISSEAARRAAGTLCFGGVALW